MGKNIRFLDEQFWHRQAPVDSICIYRLGFGVLLFFEMVGKFPNAVELFSDQGFHTGLLSGAALSPLLTISLCVILVMTTFFVAIGLWTRLSISVSLILWTYLYFIDAINAKAIDSVVIVVMGFLLFSNCHARYSVDDWLRIRKKLPRKNPSTCVFVQRLLQIEFVQTYYFAGLVKMTYADWGNGVTVARALMGRWATPFSVWMTGWLAPIGFRMIEWATIAYEVIGSVLLFSPKLRKYIIAAGVCFHVGTLLTLYVDFLAWHFIWALLILFPDPETIFRITERIKKRAGCREKAIDVAKR